MFIFSGDFSIQPIPPDMRKRILKKTGPTLKLAPHHQLLQNIVTETPAATLEEIREQLPVKFLRD